MAKMLEVEMVPVAGYELEGQKCNHKYAKYLMCFREIIVLDANNAEGDSQS